MTRQIFFGTHCIEGVELVADGLDGPSVVNKAAQVVPARPIRSSLEGTLVEAFTSAETDGDLLAFVEAYGFPCAPKVRPDGRQEVAISWLRTWQTVLRDMLADLNGGRHIQVRAIIAELMSEPDFRLAPTFEYVDGKLVVVLRAFDLRAMMFMDVLAIAESGVRVMTCKRCGSFFITGSGTKRTDKAVYCSTRCRVADGRERRRLECLPGGVSP